MNALRNKVQLIGHLGMDPEVRTTETGKKLARMSVATNESYRNANGERVVNTQWHTIVAWGKMAETICQKLHKGQEIMLEGKLLYREYTDKTGVKRNVTEIQLTELLLMDKN